MVPSEDGLVFCMVPSVVHVMCQFGYYFGIAFFAVEAIGTVVLLISSLENLSDASFVINFSMVVVLLGYTTFGAVAYLAFGDETEAPVTENFDSDDWYMSAVKAVLAVSLVCTFPIQVFPVSQMLDGYATTGTGCVVVRLCGAIVPVALAMVIPSMATFLSILGAVAATTLGSILPVWLYLTEFSLTLSPHMKGLGVLVLSTTFAFSIWSIYDAIDMIN